MTRCEYRADLSKLRSQTPCSHHPYIITCSVISTNSTAHSATEAPAYPTTRNTMVIKIFFLIMTLLCAASAAKYENWKMDGYDKPQPAMPMPKSGNPMSKPKWAIQPQSSKPRQSRKMKMAKQLAKQRCNRRPALVCNLRPIGEGMISGSVLFTPAFKMTNKRPLCFVRIRALVKGLTAKYQAIHIHQYGDISAMDGASTGGHFSNPRGKSVMHGQPGDKQRHWGDFGNLMNRNGSAKYHRVDSVITLRGIVGRAITVHAGRDKGANAQPSGDAGPRVADCVIGFANPGTVEM